MQEGKIVRLTDKGFGFIEIEGQEKNVFFHANELNGVEYNDLNEGDVVAFEVEDAPKGPVAKGVSRK
jgi:CspA family cold shock protein